LNHHRLVGFQGFSDGLDAAAGTGQRPHLLAKITNALNQHGPGGNPAKKLIPSFETPS